MLSRLTGFELRVEFGGRQVVRRIKAFSLSIPLLVLASCCDQATASEVRVMSGGWVLAADASTGTFSVDAGPLGRLIESGRFWVREESGTRQANGWIVQAVKEALVIRTNEPKMEWKLSVSGDVLHVSSTDYRSLLTAEAPSKIDRILVRLLDKEGGPVVWSGTGEVADGYGGNYTRSSSFLPRTNPDVMYVRLGRLEGRGFHSLFDRSTDTAVDFPEDATLHRDESNNDILKITMPVAGNSIVRVERDYYTRVLGVPYYASYDDRRFSTAPIVWSSWTSYYEAVREQDITLNAEWLGSHLKPYGFEYVELDDGYDRGPKGEHYWIENWDEKKFPHGAAWLTKYIRDHGMKAGIWLVPNSYAGALQSHPERYLYDKKGAVVQDYSTPALDQTNPATFDWLNMSSACLTGGALITTSLTASMRCRSMCRRWTSVGFTIQERIC